MAEKKTKTVDIRDMKKASHEDLETKSMELKKDLMNLRFQKAGGQLKDHSQIRKIKRNVARLKTYQNEKKVNKG